MINDILRVTTIILCFCAMIPVWGTLRSLYIYRLARLGRYRKPSIIGSVIACIAIVFTVFLSYGILTNYEFEKVLGKYADTVFNVRNVFSMLTINMFSWGLFLFIYLLPSKALKHDI